MRNTIKKISEYLGIFCFIIAMVLIVSPSVYWFINDDLTNMQLFKETWKVYPFAFLLLAVGYHLLDQ